MTLSDTMIPTNLIPAWLIQCREHGDDDDSLFLLSKTEYPTSHEAFDAIKKSLECDGDPDRFYAIYAGSVWIEPDQAHRL